MRYARPTTLEEAVAEVARGATPLAGGTILGHEIANTFDERFLVDLADIASLREVAEEDGSVRVGAMVTMAEAAASPLLAGAFADAAGAMGNPNIRRAATVGGNIASRSFPDLHAVLLVLDARVECVGRGELSAAELVAGGVPRGAVIASIRLPRDGVLRSAFVKFAARAASGRTIAGVAGAVAADGGARLAMTGIDIGARRLVMAEAAFASGVEASARAAREECGLDGYHSRLVSEGVRRVLA